MAKIVDRFQPGFSLFPLNNNRTGYQPVNIPLILFVPFIRTVDGFPIGNSDIDNLIFFIEDAPGKTPVAGFQNRGIFVPDFERFRVEISKLQLSSVKINPSSQRFFDQTTLLEKDFGDVINGDLMEISMLRGPTGSFGKAGPGPRDVIPYFADADYYDLSPFIIETVDLRNGRYNFVWQCDYFKRLISSNDELICIDVSKPIKARFANMINHPGELHYAMIKKSPATYFSSPSLDKDGTIAFYRPFADALQDIFDEQLLLKGINWIDKIPAQYIPYLANLIGLSLPYFPSTTDDIRRAMLRNGRKLQQLRGSRRAITELFEIFGFTIDIANLWFSKDGRRFIAPNENLPSDIDNQEITTEVVCTTEPLISNFKDPGFGQIEVPLLFKPVGNITIDAYLVSDGSAEEQALQNALNKLSTNIEAFGSDGCTISSFGFLSSSFQSTIPTNAIGHSKILFSQQDGGVEETHTKIPVINATGLKYDNDDNRLSIVFDHYFGFDKQKLFVFATYERVKIVLPDILADLRSNRFDINVLLFKDGQQPSSDIYDFLLDFLFKFKAFHSLLRKIAFTVEVADLYNVQDFCVGGRVAQSSDSDLGNLQTFRAIVPNEVLEPGDPGFVCTEESLDRGFKASDLALRDEALALLEEEHRTWKDLDGTHDISESELPVLQSLSRLLIKQPADTNCQYTSLGQDRVLRNDKDFDHNVDDREKLCDLSGNVKDYCYKGRVIQEIEIDQTAILEDLIRCRPCGLMTGMGLFYLTPLLFDNELSDKSLDFTDINNYNRSRHAKDYVRIMAFDKPELHFTDRNYIDGLNDEINNRFFATNRPSLDIDKDNLFFPGHRFISIGNLEGDYNHQEYNLRPWDDVFGFACPEDVPSGVVVPDLNARLELNSNDDEILLYDEADLIYYGNGIKADIPSLSNHNLSDISQNDIVHTVWSSAEPGLKWSQGISFGSKPKYLIDHSDDSTRFPLEALGVYKDTICLNGVLDPIFGSADVDCPCPDTSNVFVAQDLEDIENSTTVTALTGTGTGTDITDITSEQQVGVDFIDGYPAEFGAYEVNIKDLDFPRETIVGYGFSIYGLNLYGEVGGEELLDQAMALGLPLIGTDDVGELLFKVGSGIRIRARDFNSEHYEPHRLDCGCLKYDCEHVSNGTNITAVENEVAALTLSECSLKFFQSKDGTFDWNCDRVETEPIMILKEEYGARSCLLDGGIPNLMMFDDDKKVFTNQVEAFEQNIPEEGSFKFIDDYGIIYRVIFETFQSKLDYTIQIQDPRLPGEVPTGEVINKRVFKDGLETNERQILQIVDDGFIIIAEGGTQVKNRFQTTFGCGDETFDNPFAFDLNFRIVDELEFDIIDVTAGTTDITVGTDITADDDGTGGT